MSTSIYRSGHRFVCVGCSPVRRGSALFDDTIFDPEQDDAIAVEVVDDGIANRHFADAVLAPGAADDDASPLRAVVCGDAVHQDIADMGVLCRANRHQTRDLGFGLAGDTVDEEVAERGGQAVPGVAADEDSIRTPADGVQGFDDPVVLVEERDRGVRTRGVDYGQGPSPKADRRMGRPAAPDPFGRSCPVQRVPRLSRIESPGAYSAEETRGEGAPCGGFGSAGGIVGAGGGVDIEIACSLPGGPAAGVERRMASLRLNQINGPGAGWFSIEVDVGA